MGTWEDKVHSPLVLHSAVVQIFEAEGDPH